jgi:hypothetical protein
MKRFHILVVSGVLLAAAAYLGLPSLFAYLEGRSGAKHVEVSTAKVAAVHITTSDPETTLMVSENEGVISVIVSKIKKDGDYVDARIYVQQTNLDLGLLLSNRRSGIVTIFEKSDADGLPTKKSVSSPDGVHGYYRTAIEWIESPPREKRPNQSSEPMPLARHGSP